MEDRSEQPLVFYRPDVERPTDDERRLIAFAHSNPDVPACEAEDDAGWLCTMPEQHPGRHIATDGLRKVYSIWGDDDA